MGLLVRQANARLAAASRTRFPDGTRKVDAHKVEQARDEMLAARLEEAIDEALHPATPYKPLSSEQRARLAALLRGGK